MMQQTQRCRWRFGNGRCMFVFFAGLQHATTALDQPWDARVNASLDASDRIITLRRCGGEGPGGGPACKFCADDSPVLGSDDVIFDLSDLHNFTQYALVPMAHQELQMTKMMVSPCGASSPAAWAAPAGYDTSACNAAGNNGTACFCNADSGRECSLVGAAGREGINETWEGGRVQDMTAYALHAQPLGLRVTYTSTSCLPGISKCGGRCSATFVFLCSAAPRYSATQELLGYPQQTLHEEVCPASKSDEPCSMCLMAASRSMCQYLPCKDNCSSRGLCVDGECVCGSGFTGVYCNQQPTCFQAAAARGVNCSKYAECTFYGENGGGTDISSLEPRCVCPAGFAGDGVHCTPSALSFHVRGQEDAPNVIAATTVAAGVGGEEAAMNDAHAQCCMSSCAACAIIFALMYCGMHRRLRRRRGQSPIAYGRVSTTEEPVPGAAVA